MHLTPRVLENHVVRLEPLEERHRGPLRELADDESIWRYMTERGDGEHFDSWFESMLAGQARGDQISHAVFDVRGDAPQIVGHSAYLVMTPAHARAEIGWTWYGKAARGGQVNPACKLLLLANLFDSGAVRAELKTHHLNEHSQRAMLKMGASFEGRQRRHTRTWRGDYRDTMWYSILADEWPEVRAGLLARVGDSGN